MEQFFLKRLLGVLFLSCSLVIPFPAFAQIPQALRVSDIITNSPWTDARAYGAQPNDSSVDSSIGIQAALNTMLPVILPIGIYYCKSQIDLKGNKLIGMGWNSVGTDHTRLIFSNIASGAPAIVTRAATTTGVKVAGLKDLYVQAADWTTITGNGLDIESPILMENVVVSHFKLSNIIFHQNSSVTGGPYGSRITDCKFWKAGQHGGVVGAGANVLTLINCDFKWNGAPAFNMPPSVAGNYDGLHVDANTFNGAYPGMNVFGLKIIGGDYSYNSRYGFNFENIQNSSLFPDYAEGNLDPTHQVRVGLLMNVLTVIGSVYGGPSAIKQDTTIGPDNLTNALFLGGEYLGHGDRGIYSYFFKNIQNLILAYKDGSNYVYLKPDNTTGSVNLFPSGTGVVKIGSGARYFAVSNNIPQIQGLNTFADDAAYKAAGGITGGLFKDSNGFVHVGK